MKTARTRYADNRVLATFRKNNTQEVRLSVANHGSRDFIDLRLYEATIHSAGEPLPTESGICLPRTKLRMLIDALVVAEAA